MEWKEKGKQDISGVSLFFLSARFNSGVRMCLGGSELFRRVAEEGRGFPAYCVCVCVCVCACACVCVHRSP